MSESGKGHSVRDWPRSRGLILGGVIVAVLFLLIIGVFTPDAAANPNGQYGASVLINVLFETTTNGVVLLVWLLAAYGYGHKFPLPLRGAAARGVGGGVHGDATTVNAVPSRRTPLPNPLPQGERGPDFLLRNVTAIALGIALIGFLVLGLGLAGLMNRGTAWAILAMGVALLPWKRIDRIKPWLRERSPSTILAWPLAIPLGLMLSAAMVMPGFLWKPLDPHPYDVVSYHLQVPREWFEIGRIVPLPHNSFSYFPMAQEMHSLLAMHLFGSPWAGMYFSQFVSVAFTMLASLAVVGAVRANHGRTPWPAGWVAACVPWSIMLGSVAYVESGVMLYSTLALGWGIRAVSREVLKIIEFHDGAMAVEHRIQKRSLLLAGLCAGLAGGFKYTALAMTALPMFVLLPFYLSRGRGHLLRAWLIAGLAGLLVLSPWLVRNEIWAGNPVFPLATKLLGDGPFTAEQVSRYVIAHKPPVAEQGLVARLGAAWDRTIIDPQFGYFVALSVGVALWALCRSREVGFGGQVVLIAFCVWVIATHNMPRFLAPIIGQAAIICGLTRLLAFRVQRGFTVVLAIVAAFGVGWTLNTLWPMLNIPRQGLFALTDPTPLLLPDVQIAMQNGGKLALVGDCQAFRYPFPAGRLKYRGVFDVVIPPNTSLADGWLGEPIDQLRREGWTVLVDPAELDRLSKTYAHLPKPAAPFDNPAAGVVVLGPIR